MSKFVFVAINVGAATLGAILIALAARPARDDTRGEGGLRIVEVGAGMKFVSAVVLVIAGTMFVALTIFWPDDPEDMPYAVAVLAILVLVGSSFSYLLFVFRISYDDNFIHVNTLIHRNRRIPWTSVVAVDYSELWLGWRIRTSAGVRFWVYSYHAGYTEFLQTVENRISMT